MTVRKFVFSAAAIVIAAANVQATESLFFNGDDYTIQILVGYTDDPVVAQVRFTSPGAKEAVALPREALQVEKFNMKKEILTMRFSNKNNSDLPGSFSLSVKNSKAVLSIGGKEIKGEFNWEI